MKREPRIAIVIVNKRVGSLKQTLEDLKRQTYRSIKIFYASNHSPNPDSRFIRISKKNANIASVASSYKNFDYYCSLRRGDRLETDFFRQMIDSGKGSDIIIPNIVECRSDGDYGFIDFKQDNLCFNHKNIFHSYLKISRRIYRLYEYYGFLFSNKTTSRISPPSSSRLLLSNIIFPTLAFSVATSVRFCDEAYILIGKKSSPFYCSEEEIVASFNYLLKVFPNYSKKIARWRETFIFAARQSGIPISNSLYKTLDRANEHYFQSFEESKVIFHDIFSPIAETIRAHDTISFDVFDTLLLRPFFEPRDMLKLLDKYASTTTDRFSIARFSDIRIESEFSCRKEAKKNGREDITIKEIYDYMSDHYLINKKDSFRLLKKELELELRFSKPRKFGLRLFKLSRYLGKKIIIASDMYLSKETIGEMLTKNGYDYDDIFVSSTSGHTKHSGLLFADLLTKYPRDSILHIDDNLENCKSAERKGIKALKIDRTIEVFLNHYSYLPQQAVNYLQNNRAYLSDDSVRTSLAIVANHLFDEPYILRDPSLGFKKDPSEMGFFVLGMNILCLSVWLLRSARDNNIESLCFLARDGFLPHKASCIIQSQTSYYNKIRLSYAYASRKAFLPLSLRGNCMNFSLYAQWQAQTPEATIQQLLPVLDNHRSFGTFYEKHGLAAKEPFQSQEEFLRFLRAVSKELYSPSKYLSYANLVKDYFDNFLIGKSAIFDIGYSARPEYLLNSLLRKDLLVFFNNSTCSLSYDLCQECGNSLKKYFDYIPACSGALREVFFSSLKPGCLGYKRSINGNIEPILKKKNDIDALTSVSVKASQQAALAFVEEYASCFRNDINLFEFSHPYMSLPFETYLNCSSPSDHYLLRHLVFNADFGLKYTMSDLWSSRISDNINYYNANLSPDNDSLLPAKRLPRIIYYLLFDRKRLYRKISEKTLETSRSESILRYPARLLLSSKRRLTKKNKSQHSH